MSIDTLITNASSRANGYAVMANNQALGAYSLVIDEAQNIKIQLEDSELKLNPSFVGLAATPKPTFAFPTFAPQVVTPTKPTFLDANRVNVAVPSDVPVVNTVGLFQQTKPNDVIPEFTEPDPSFLVDELSTELGQLVRPTLNEFEFPALTDIVIGEVPTLILPELDEGQMPEAMPDPERYDNIFKTEFVSRSETLPALIRDRVDTWISKYAPNFAITRHNLESKLNTYLESDGTVLPDDVEDAMFNRATMRSKRELLDATEAILTQNSNRGFISAPGSVNSALNKARFSTAEILTQQATDIYIKRKEIEVQHLQFVLGLSNDQINNVRQLAIQQAQVELGTLQLSSEMAKTVADFAGTVFEHFARRVEAQIRILDALNARFDAKLKAALSSLEGFKLQLDAEKTKLDVDQAKISAIEARYRAEGIKIQSYTALVDALVKRGDMERIKASVYQTKADVFRTRVGAQTAAFDLYKAAIAGDEAKLRGELAKLQAFETQLKVAEAKVNVEVATNSAIKSYNDVQESVFQSETKLASFLLEASLREFTAKVDIEKLRADIFKTELGANLSEFTTLNQQETTLLDAKVKEFSANLEVKIKAVQVELDKLRAIQGISSSVVSTYGNMASSALNSLNTMVSNVVSAAS